MSRVHCAWLLSIHSTDKAEPCSIRSETGAKMQMVFESLVAVFALIGLGWALRQFNIINTSQWPAVERLTYLVLFPAVIIQTLGSAKLVGVPFAALAMTLITTILIMSAIVLALRPLLLARGISGPAYTSVFQGALRWNSFVALALAGALLGSPGLALMAVAIVAMVPLLNVICVWVLSHDASGGPVRPAAMAKAIIANPFIWSSAIGLALNPAYALVPKALVLGLDVLSRSGLAVGLLVVGSGLELARLAKPGLPHITATVVKLLLMPAVVMICASFFGLTGNARTIAIVTAAMPTASAAYILARQMGGDAELMAEITTVQTLLALLTIPLVLALAGP
jgi:malonate transporter and related proteins